MQDQLLTDRFILSESVAFTPDHDIRAALKRTRERLGEASGIGTMENGSVCRACPLTEFVKRLG
jgi:hypothetical protein